jgi:hypothetical protein
MRFNAGARAGAFEVTIGGLFAGLVLVFAGCGSSGDREKVVPVSGVVTYQGKPLEGYRVTFMPTDGRRPAIGLTDAEGKFALGTNEVGDGAVVGTHKVAFVWAPPVIGEPGQETVTDNPANLPKPKTRIPDKYTDPEKSGITQEVPSRGISDLRFELP